MSRILIEKYSDIRYDLHKTAQSILKYLQRLLNSNQFNDLYFRTKDEKSLLKKIIAKENKYRELKEITDLIGFRIITYFSDEVDVICKILEKSFKIDYENSINKGSDLNYNQFGYSSIHYVFELTNELLEDSKKHLNGYKVEIQIRTMAQHVWAENEHKLGYKNIFSIPHNIGRKFSRIAAMLELIDEEFISIKSLIENYNNSLKDLNSDELLKKKINIDTLEYYYNYVEDIIEAEKEIAQEINAELKNYRLFFENIIHNIKDLGFSKLNDIHKYFLKNKDRIIKFAKIRLSKREYISNGILLWYICYDKILQFSDKELIVNYLKKNKISYEGYADYNELVENLLSDYEKVKSECKN